jgi:hypothetical protein
MSRPVSQGTDSRISKRAPPNSQSSRTPKVNGQKMQRTDEKNAKTTRGKSLINLRKFSSSGPRKSQSLNGPCQ